MREQRYVRLTGLADGTEIRTATFEDQEHIVVPVIMLVGDIVVWPMNRPGPELVLGSELEKAALSWNGRNVLPDHPSGGAASANTPEILEAMQFGRVFGARYEDSKLKGDAWLNVARAEEVGDDAMAVIDRVKAGEMVEVSIGAWVTAEESNGTHNGQRYEVIWRDIKSDHLAMLPEGLKGACSIEDGCGGPRVNQDGRTEKPMMYEKAIAIMDSLKRMWNGNDSRANQAEGEKSDIELRNSLHDALRAEEPGFFDIDSVFTKSKEVVYLVFPEDRVLWFRRTFKLAKDGTVTLNDDRQEVELITKFEPVAASQTEVIVDPTLQHQKDCKSVAVAAASCPCNNPEGEELMDKKIRELIEGLIANERAPFTEECSESLAAFSEAQLSAMAESFAEVEEPEPKPEPKPEPVVEDVDDGDDDGPKEKTDDEWLAEAPESLRRLVTRSVNEEVERRTILVASIAKSTKVWTEDALKEKTTEDLESIALAVKADKPKPDFSNRVLETPEEDEVVRAPKPYDVPLKALREGSTTN